MASSWEEFVAKVEDPSPGEAVVDATIKWFRDVLKVPHPALAEGYTEESVSSQLPKELPVQACARRILRAVDAVGQARRMSQATGVVGAASSGSTPGAPASAQSLARILAPGKLADVANLLKDAGLKGISFSLQAEQNLWNHMQQHSEDCKITGKTPFLFVDLTSKETLPMWLTPDHIGGKFQLHDEGDWPLRGQVPIASLQDLGKALKSATASPRFFRTISQWSGAFLRYAVVAIATKQMTWQSALSHMDIVWHLAEQERMKGNLPFLAFLYEELLRKSWARRAEKGDPSLNIEVESQKLDKDLVDIARHRLIEVMKEAGLSGVSDTPGQGSKDNVSLAVHDSILSRQLAAAEAAQKQSERVSKQLVETQQQLLHQSKNMMGSQTAAVKPGNQQPTKRQIKTHNWFQKTAQRRQEQQRQKQSKQQR